MKTFYTATIQKVSFWRYSSSRLGPDKVTTYSVIRLAKHFPQLELSDSTSLDQLRDDFLDFTLSPMDLPTQTEYTAADKTNKK